MSSAEPTEKVAKSGDDSVKQSPSKDGSKPDPKASSAPAAADDDDEEEEDDEDFVREWRAMLSDEFFSLTL